MNKLDNCSNEEISSVLEGAIAVTHYPTASSHPSQLTSRVRNVYLHLSTFCFCFYLCCDSLSVGYY